MSRTSLVLRSLAVLAAAVPTLLGGMWPKSFGWFAYAPLTAGSQMAPAGHEPWPGSALSVAMAEQAPAWAGPALPVALALLAVWAPRRTRPAGVALVLAGLAVELLLPRGPVEDTAVHWASVGALAVAAALLLAARGAPPARQPLVPALAWTAALLVLTLRPVASGLSPLGLHVHLAAEAVPLVLVACLAAVAASATRPASGPQVFASTSHTNT